MIGALDAGLRTVFVPTRAARPSPSAALPAVELGSADRQQAAALMRVNHVGEICAQALYESQALFSRSESLRQHFEHAAQEELDHLAWTAERVAELGGHTSHLAPLWWMGAFACGSLAGLAGDKWSLGFVVETERQVEAHLDSHLGRLPEQDLRSREIVTQMKVDEVAHADTAVRLGAVELPAPVKAAMKATSKLMTGVAYWL